LCSATEVNDNSNATARDILAALRSTVDANLGVTRFSISRAHIWEGARRTILRPTFDPRHAMSVKFTDDIGVSEGAVDQGGPRREFLQLLTDFLATSSPVFIGPADAKHLNVVSQGNEWKCFFVENVRICIVAGVVLE